MTRAILRYSFYNEVPVSPSKDGATVCWSLRLVDNPWNQWFVS